MLVCWQLNVDYTLHMWAQYKHFFLCIICGLIRSVALNVACNIAYLGRNLCRRSICNKCWSCIPVCQT